MVKGVLEHYFERWTYVKKGGTAEYFFVPLFGMSLFVYIIFLGDDFMKAILTVIGEDKVGIIAGVSAELEKFNINILNVSQTIMDNYFTMMMMTDIKDANVNFDAIKAALSAKGKELGVDIKIQREDIFKSMHSL